MSRSSPQSRTLGVVDLPKCAVDGGYAGCGCWAFGSLYWRSEIALGHSMSMRGTWKSSGLRVDPFFDRIHSGCYSSQCLS